MQELQQPSPARHQVLRQLRHRRRLSPTRLPHHTERAGPRVPPAPHAKIRRLAFAVTLASLAALPTTGVKARRACDCPTVAVSCPNSLRVGEDATFSVTMMGADPAAKPTYNWVVSAGTVRSGQGTRQITVDLTGVSGNSELTATVEVAGLPASCTATASCSTGIMAVIFHDKLDEYGDISFEDEKARLDNYAIELVNWPEGVGYVMAYGGRRSHRGEALRRAERAKRYLTNVRGIAAERIVTIDGGYREELTVELKIRSKELSPPVPAPTVDPGDVQFIEPAPKRRTRRP